MIEDNQEQFKSVSQETSETKREKTLSLGKQRIMEKI